MKSLLIILAGLALCWQLTDLGSEQSLYSRVAPLGLTLFLIALMIWLVLKAGFGGKTGSGGDGGSGGDDGGFGGDGGCGGGD